MMFSLVVILTDGVRKSDLALLPAALAHNVSSSGQIMHDVEDLPRAHDAEISSLAGGRASQAADRRVATGCHRRQAPAPSAHCAVSGVNLLWASPRQAGGYTGRLGRNCPRRHLP